MMLEFLRRVFNSPCAGCEVLKYQLETTNIEKKRLLDYILDEPAKIPQEPVVQHKPMLPKMIPWRVKQQMLEAEDRARAAVMQGLKSNEELEKELLGKGDA